MKKIAFLGAKGGVAKTSLCATIAVALEKAGWQVLVADMNRRQCGITKLAARRKENNIQPYINSKVFQSVDHAIDKAERENFDFVIFDGTGDSGFETYEIASQVDLIVLPTGPSKLDREPQISLASVLTEKGIKKNKIIFTISMVIDGEEEAQVAVNRIKAKGYKCTQGFIKRRKSFISALDIGKTLLDVRSKSIREPVEMVIQDIYDRIK